MRPGAGPVKARHPLHETSRRRGSGAAQHHRLLSPPPLKEPLLLDPGLLLEPGLALALPLKEDPEPFFGGGADPFLRGLSSWSESGERSRLSRFLSLYLSGFFLSSSSAHRCDSKAIRENRRAAKAEVRALKVSNCRAGCCHRIHQGTRKLHTSASSESIPSEDRLSSDPSSESSEYSLSSDSSESSCQYSTRLSSPKEQMSHQRKMRVRLEQTVSAYSFTHKQDIERVNICSKRRPPLTFRQTAG